MIKPIGLALAIGSERVRLPHVLPAGLWMRQAPPCAVARVPLARMFASVASREPELPADYQVRAATHQQSATEVNAHVSPVVMHVFRWRYRLNACEY